MRAFGWISAVMVSVAATLSAHAAEGVGLTARDDEPHWQGRLAFGTTAPGWNPGYVGHEPSPMTLYSLSLMADYHFGAYRLGTRSGSFRATSGLILGQRTALATLWAGAPAHPARRSTFSVDRRIFGPSAQVAGIDADVDYAALPYVGIGYSGLSASGWSLSADLGLVASAPGQVVRLGRFFNGSQSLDDALRELRLAPVIQFGASYSF